MPQQMSSSELYERGFTLMELRMFHPAIDDFQIAARDVRYARKAYVPMGLCLRALGRHEEAVVAFRRALRLPMVSSFVQHHILYHLARTLEFLGRVRESREVYGWINKEDPEFLDVAQRIRFVDSDLGRFSLWVCSWRGKIGSWVSTRQHTLSPFIQPGLDQTEQWLGRSMDMYAPPDQSEISSSLPDDEAIEAYAHPDGPRGELSRQGTLVS